MQHIPLLAAQIVRPIVAYLDANGADSTAFLDRARIPGEVIDAGGWIAKKQAYDMVHDVAQREPCSGIIFSAFSEFEFDDLGPMAATVRSARTLKDALRTFTRLAGLAYEGNEYFLRCEGKTTWLCYRDREQVSFGSVAAQQATLAIFTKLVRLLVDDCWDPREVRTQFRLEANVQEKDSPINCEHVHDGRFAAIAIPNRFVSRDLNLVSESRTTADAGTWWLQEDPSDDQFVDSLHRLVASRFRYRGFPTLEQIAAIVGTSTRTIKRRLASNGLSYRHLLDRICFDAARELLLFEDCSVKETALALGYRDSSKFVRSFRRMAGVTPGEYCRRAR